jgi:truncated hemoglobin YjbI
MPFPIGVKERDAWLKNMSAAIDQTPEFNNHAQILRDYFLEFATFLINKSD